MMRSAVAVVWLLLAASSWAADDVVLLPIPAPPLINSTSYVLLEVHTGKVIVEKNADRRVAPASLAKIMTSYIFAEQLSQGFFKADETVKVSKLAWAQNPAFKGSSLMFIEPAKPVTLNELHRGLIVSSGNDASVAIAEHLGGGVEGFVALMNHAAQQLGMTNSHFVNPHGLSSDQETYTSANDIVLLTKEYIKRFPDQYALYAQRSFTYNGFTQHNRNRLLGKVEGLDGVKTGYTEEAGYCLVSSAQRDGMRLVAAVFGAASDAARLSDSRRLLEYGFRYFELVQPVQRGEQVMDVEIWGSLYPSVPLVVAEDVWLTLPEGRDQLLERIIDTRDRIEAPFAAGEEMGVMILYLGGTIMARVPLLTAMPAERAPFWNRISQKLRRTMRDWWRQQGIYRWLYG